MSLRAVACVMLAVAFASQSLSAAPTINNVSLRGLQIGGTTQLVVQGTELAGDVKLLAPFAIAKQEVLPGSTGQQVQLAITLAEDVTPGIYQVRLGTPTGITPPLTLGVDRLPQAPLAEQAASLPIAMSGALGGGQIIKVALPGKQAQNVVIDLEAVRLGANFKPVVRLYDSRGKQLSYSPPQIALGGDARLALQLPADDNYTIELHDVLYRAAGPGFFRLKIGELQFADFALPLAVTHSTKSSVQAVATNLPANTTAEVDASAVTHRAQRVGGPFRSPLFTAAQPRVLITEQSEAVEAPAANGAKQTLSSVPCGVSGTIAARGEEDQYLVPVTPGQKLRIDVTARRLGSTLDGVLTIRGPAGNELARNDDQPGTADPGLDFTVPGGVQQLLVCVRDMEKRFSNTHVYHLAIRPAPQAEISATIATDTILVNAGGTTVVPISLVRTNYDGPVRIEAIGLVGDVRLDGAEIAAGANMGLLTFTAKGGQPVHGVINLIARAVDPNVNLTRDVFGPETNGATRYQPALRRDIGFAVAGESPLTLALQTTERPAAFQGDRYPVPLTIQRRAGVAGEVRLRLLTTQTVPKKKVKQNNQDKEVDDVERTLRLADANATYKPEQSEIVTNLQIPGDLPATPWSVVIVADLLSADGKSVVASAPAGALSITPQPALKLELTSTPQAEGRAGVGEAGTYTGKIARSPGFARPVVVTLEGLPPQVKQVPQITIAADQSDFTLPLTFEYGSRPGDYKKVKLTASVEGSPNPNAATEVELKIVPGTKPE